MAQLRSTPVVAPCREIVPVRVLTLSWHPPFEVITAGGHRRTYEILKRTPADVRISVIDNNPSFLSGLTRDNISLIEYKVPRSVKRIEDTHFRLERSIELILATFLFVWISLKMKLAGEKFDIVYVPGSEVFNILLAGFFVALIFRCGLVASNFNLELFPAWARGLIARLHNLASAVVTLSEDLAATLISNGVKVPIEKNGVGLDLPPFSRVSASDKTFEGIFVGRHVLSKGVVDLIDVWEKVARDLPGARLVMIGYCYPDRRTELERMIADRGLNENITISGPLDEETKTRMVMASKVCLFPSYIEGWGLVPAEALACGLPVVIYDLPVYRETVRACESVFPVPIGERAAMAQKTIELLKDNAWKRYERIGPVFVERFDWDSVAAREFNILRKYSRVAEP